MQVSEIQDRVYAITGLPSTHPRLTTTVIKNLWWEGAVRMVREVRPGYLRRDSTQNLVVAQGSYFLAADSLIVLSVKAYQSGRWGKLRKKTQEELDDLDPDWESGSTAASYYYDGGIHSTNDANYGKRIVVLSPAPLESVTNGLKVREIRRPIELDDVPALKDYIDIPLDYHEGVCNYAAWKFLKNASENPRQDVGELFQVFQADLQHFLKSQREENEYDHEPEARLPFAASSLGYWSSL
jgi:hypothetical protein